MTRNTCESVISEVLNSNDFFIRPSHIPILMSYCTSIISDSNTEKLSLPDSPNTFFAKCFRIHKFNNDESKCLTQKDNITSLFNEWIEEIKKTLTTKMVISVCFSKINKFINNTYYRRSLIRKYLHQIRHFRIRQNSPSCSGKKKAGIIHISGIKTQIQ
ncbi:variable surface protein [Plasmodium gonderi]|uniref:Variable surface protein n=1 Tax=Plasmodium gonderi TaxID=77519 RepID=A0A1Y1JUX6_PLAGO|nr:variable surface protein [Plasmodium gonderi]GAW84552.1 variable surface protein [Plasmodium gonderi]